MFPVIRKESIFSIFPILHDLLCSMYLQKHSFLGKKKKKGSLRNVRSGFVHPERGFLITSSVGIINPNYTYSTLEDSKFQ